MKFIPEINKIKKVMSKILFINNKLIINTSKDIMMKLKPIAPKNFIGEKIRKILKIR